MIFRKFRKAKNSDINLAEINEKYRACGLFRG